MRTNPFYRTGFSFYSTHRDLRQLTLWRCSSFLQIRLPGNAPHVKTNHIYANYQACTGSESGKIHAERLLILVKYTMRNCKEEIKNKAKYREARMEVQFMFKRFWLKMNKAKT